MRPTQNPRKENEAYDNMSEGREREEKRDVNADVIGDAMRNVQVFL